jgi:uncharacterized glyoxalase superfamily protein PhnB
MSANITNPAGTIVPTLRYRDVTAAIDWLCNTLGFKEHLVVHADNGSVRYAELTFGNGMIMLGPVDGTGLDKVMAEPTDTGGAETYLFVADAAAHCDRAKAAGAQILLDIDDAHSDGRGYSCRDLEGHVWNFGTYDPWKRETVRPAVRRGRLRGLTLAMGSLIAATAGVVLAGWLLGVSDVSDFGMRLYASASVGDGATGAVPDPIVRDHERGIITATDRLVRERDERETALSAARESQAQLARERGVRETPERHTSRAGEREATAEAERVLEDARQQLVRERSAREQAQRGAQEARERLSLAERTGRAMQEQLVAERNARETAESAAQEARQQLAKEQGAKEAAQRALKETHLVEARGRAAATARRLAPRPRGLLSSTSESRS